MSGLTGTNYPLCMYVCQSVRVFDGPASDTYDNTAVSDSSGVWEWLFWSWMTPFLLIARLYLFIFCFCLRFQPCVCSHPTHCTSSALQCGTEKWRDRRREWTDVTVSRCRSSQTLTHFHSAHHKRPAVFICLGAVPVSSGRVTFSRGVGFHCLPLTRARPQPPVCVHLCVDVVSWGDVFVCVVFAQQRSETAVAPETAPSSLFQPYEIERAPCHVPPPHRPAASFDASFRSLHSATQSRIYNHLRVKFIDYMLTVTFRCCKLRTLDARGMHCRPKGTTCSGNRPSEWHFTAVCSSGCQHAPIFSAMLGIFSWWLM